MVSTVKTKTKQRNRFQLSFSESDVKQLFGDYGENLPLSLVKHWVKLGRSSEALVSDMVSQIENMREVLEKKLTSHIVVFSENMEKKLESRFQKLESQIENLSDKIENLSEELFSFEKEFSKTTDLQLHTSKLIALTSSLAHFELEVLKDQERRGEISDFDASKKLLAEIKEINFDRFLAENFPKKSANRFLAATTKVE